MIKNILNNRAKRIEDRLREQIAKDIEDYVEKLFSSDKGRGYILGVTDTANLVRGNRDNS